MSTLRTLHFALALSVLACGPKLPADDTDASSGGATTAPASTGSTSGTTAADPTSTSTSSTGEPTGSSTSSSTTGTSTGCSFLDCNTTDPGFPPCLVVDGELRCLPCDVWSQDCPDGQKCTASTNNRGDAWNKTTCVDVAPNPGKPGDPCTVEGYPTSGKDTCDGGSMCWYIDKDTLAGTCVPLCTGSQENPMCADPGDYCLIANDGVLNLCLPGCDPLAQDCAPKQVCIAQPMGDGFICAIDASGEMGQQNDPCEYANACDPGLICANPALATECDPMAAGCCLPFCDLSDPQCTNQGALCLPWHDMNMAPPGYENVGVCGLMQ